MKTRLRIGVSLLCVAVCALAQAPVGSLTGTVHDSSGGMMAGAAITVANRRDIGIRLRGSGGLQRGWSISAIGLPVGGHRHSSRIWRAST